MDKLVRIGDSAWVDPKSVRYVESLSSDGKPCGVLIGFHSGSQRQYIGPGIELTDVVTRLNAVMSDGKAALKDN